MTWFRQRRSATPHDARLRGGLAALWALGVLLAGMTGSAGSAGAVAALTAPPGGSIAIAGTVSPSPSCPAGDPVQLTSTPATAGGTNLFPNGVGPQVPRAANGNFQATITIPAATPVGSYTIGVRCNGANAGAVQVLNVTAAPAKPSVAVTPATAHPGDSITISGTAPTTGASACPATDTVQATSTAALFPPDGFGPRLTRDAAGNLHGAYTIPKTTAVGSYTIGLRCGGGNLGVSATLQVTAASATTTTAATTTTTTTVVPTTAFTPNTLPTLSTTLPTVATTAAPTKAKSSSNRNTVRWVGLAALVALVIAAVALLSSRRGGGEPGGLPPAPPGPPPLA